MPSRPPQDRAAREQALDPTTSFIVQAPAGSGKTGLLTQRFLTLLAGVREPEEIVAITFTKKAAAEMRNRILDALRRAASIRDLADRANWEEGLHAKRTRELAEAALKHDRKQKWELLKNPQRLRIQTIDSFNAALTRQMPLLTRLGAQPAIVEDARDHLLEAARIVLEPPNSDAPDERPWREAVTALHGHLDGDLARARALIASMLTSRDQWIWHVADGKPGLSRQALEGALERAVREELALVVAAFPAVELARALDLLQIAASNLRDGDKAGSDNARAIIAGAEAAAGGVAADAEPASLPVWRGLSTLLLTGDGALRSPKGINANLGFPPDAANAPHKKALQDLLAGLDDGLAARLERVRILPPTTYSEDHWALLGALADLLPRAVAALETVFAAEGEVDFAEVSLRALSALRDGELPTDLALALDHRISHLLVDEFQDTSVNQLHLIERLTEGWAAGDGRTLFVVGDPMQSIYRFRKAEVGLFMQAMAAGIGSVPLTTLKLTENFRSQAALVAWTNASFEALFPRQADPANGAVPFAAATAHNAAEAGDAVRVHPLFDPDPAVEAALVCTLVKQALDEGHESVAILVSARAHLRAIMPALKAAGITPRVTDIEPLRERPMVRDLVALTRALLHRADRTAWLAVLRAPWCGLPLGALLAHIEHRALEPDDAARLARVEKVFEAARAQHRRVPLKRLVESAWLALGGPACARDQEDLADARAYFAFLSAHDVAGDLDDPAALDELMQELFAPPAPDADARVQVLTMHKAKGLEFDSVILPGLQKIGGRDEAQLLRWLDRPSTQQTEGLDLMMAALAATGADRDPIYAYVGELARQQRAAEQLRQLYVATTRPKRRLHLIGQATLAKEGVKLPRTGSLLRAMWDVTAGAFEAAAAGAVPPEAKAEEGTPIQRFRRLPKAWKLPALPPAIAALPTPEFEDDDDYLPFDWVGQTTRVVGIVVHRLLQRIAEDGIELYAQPLLSWNPDKPEVLSTETKTDPRIATKRAARIASLWPAAEALLVKEGLADAARAQALASVKQAITRTLEDPAGRWILSPHPRAASELELSVVSGGRVVALRIDRVFGDGKKRWVVDFKASSVEGSGIERFLEQQAERYAAQLARYAAATGDASAPTRSALYFPQLGRLKRT
jgi:ATP-dependent helicase/nuclease subunit A